jgi:hypothetical protein
MRGLRSFQEGAGSKNQSGVSGMKRMRRISDVREHPKSGCACILLGALE